MKIIKLLLLLSLTFSLLSCFGSSHMADVQIYPSHSVVNEQHFKKPFSWVEKIGDKEYMLANPYFGFHRVIPDTASPINLVSEELKSEYMIQMNKIDNNILVVYHKEQELSLNVCSTDKLKVLVQKKLSIEEDFKYKGAFSSENNLFTTLLFKYDDYDIYRVITVDKNLNIINELNIDILEDIVKNKEDAEDPEIVGMFVDNNGKVFISSIAEYNGWKIWNYSIEKNKIQISPLNLPKKVMDRNVDDGDYMPCYTAFKQLRDGSLLSLSVVVEDLKEMQYMTITKYDPSNLNITKQAFYFIPEDECDEIYDEDNAFVMDIPCVFESSKGDIMVFFEAVTENLYRPVSYRTRTDMNGKAQTTQHLGPPMLCAVESIFYPISIVDFSKDFEMKWIKSIPRADKSTMGRVLPYKNGPISKENMLFGQQEQDTITITYPDGQYNEVLDDKATYSLGKINFDGEMWEPIPLFTADYFYGMNESRVYKEKDGTISFFLRYSPDVSGQSDYFNIKIIAPKAEE